jgi:hyperosmotically inducible protein
LLALLLVLTMAPPESPRPAAARAQNQTATPTDPQIKADVERRLAELRPRPSLTVRVEDAIVTLSGRVPNAWAKQEAIDAARRAAGLKFVVSEIEIPRAENDRGLAFEVGQAILRSSTYTVYDDVTGGVRDGVVTLRGRVTAPVKADRLAELVARIRGVQSVKNDIEVLPASISDNDLRLEVAYSIYGDPMFLNLNMTTLPPIHVIVENGRVTLIGRVHTELEKKRAEVIAQTIAGPARVENRLLVDTK